MPSLEETVAAFANELIAQNVPGVMMYFTPEAIVSAMTLQVRLQARAAEMLAQGRTPSPATSYALEVKREMQGGRDGGQIVQITLQGPDGTAEVMTRWREVDGAWKVAELDLVAAHNPDGTPIALQGPAPGAT